MRGFKAAVLALALPLLACGAPAGVVPVAAPAGVHPLPLRVTGRIEQVTGADGVFAYRRQWPGTYLETAFQGRDAWLKLGPGEVALDVTVDGTATTLVRPRQGWFRLAGLGPGPHRLRVDVVSESQAGPTDFGGVFAGRGTEALSLPQRRRQIEFIGDSHTVGYGNRSATGTCTQDQVWATTDTAHGLAALTARRYGADYEVNAISGRGVVRNYGGFAAPTLPEAYPHVLPAAGPAPDDAGWHPGVIVIALGTNDFTTPLKPGERWADRDALHADFEATYVRFVQGLRAREPRALIVLWATDMAGGEIEAEVTRVAARLRAGGETRLTYVPVNGLRFAGCHGHPDLADDATIAGKLAAAIDAHPGVWAGG